MNEILINIKNLSIGFPQEKGISYAVKSASFSLYRGKTLALVGESGGGKTLTGLSIMQLLPDSARVSKQSEIIFEHKNILQLSELEMRKIRGKKIGMIFQDAMTALNPVLTIGNQIDEALRCHLSLKKSARKKRIINLLTQVGIKNPEYVRVSYPHQLSGGMRQRAMIAMALAPEPEILIADEPTSALDVTIAAQILTLLKKLQNKLNMTLLFITHDLGAVYRLADHVAVIYEGEIVEQKTAEEFFKHPEHPYSKRLFAVLPRIEKQHETAQQEALPLLKVKGLKVYFPIRKGIFKRTVGYVKAVDKIDFHVNQGRTLALVGESGSGKTTVGKSLVHLLKPTEGHIYFEDKNFTNKELQIIFQDPYSAMNPRMIIKDILAEGLIAQKIVKTEKERQMRIDKILQKVGLTPDIKYRYPHEFSGGQKQRICIARSLLLEPKFLVCDEPTSALDVSAQMQILKLLKSLQEQLGLSYLLITHNFVVVTYLAHDVAVMHKGKIVEQGTVSEVMSNPKHPYTKKLLDSVVEIPENIHNH